MVLKTFSFQTTGIGTIVLDDDAKKDDISKAMLIDATEEHRSDGKTPRKVKEKNNGQR